MKSHKTPASLKLDYVEKIFKNCISLVTFTYPHQKKLNVNALINACIKNKKKSFSCNELV